MTVFLATFAIILIAVLAMAIGVMMGRPSIKGSCGGLNHIGLGGSCSGACSLQEREECERRKAEQEEASEENRPCSHP